MTVVEIITLERINEQLYAEGIAADEVRVETRATVSVTVDFAMFDMVVHAMDCIGLKLVGADPINNDKQYIMMFA